MTESCKWSQLRPVHFSSNLLGTFERHIAVVVIVNDKRRAARRLQELDNREALDRPPPDPLKPIFKGTLSGKCQAPVSGEVRT